MSNKINLITKSLLACALVGIATVSFAAKIDGPSVTDSWNGPAQFSGTCTAVSFPPTIGAGTSLGVLKTGKSGEPCTSLEYKTSDGSSSCFFDADVDGAGNIQFSVDKASNCVVSSDGYMLHLTN